jgi:hypothetical protein
LNLFVLVLKDVVQSLNFTGSHFYLELGFIHFDWSFTKFSNSSFQGLVFFSDILEFDSFSFEALELRVHSVDFEFVLHHLLRHGIHLSKPSFHIAQLSPARFHLEFKISCNSISFIELVGLGLQGSLESFSFLVDDGNLVLIFNNFFGDIVYFSELTFVLRDFALSIKSWAWFSFKSGSHSVELAFHTPWLGFSFEQLALMVSQFSISFL